jgi:hypothetical protein
MQGYEAAEDQHIDGKHHKEDGQGPGSVETAIPEGGEGHQQDDLENAIGNVLDRHP